MLSLHMPNKHGFMFLKANEPSDSQISRGMAGHKPLGFGMASVYLLWKRKMSVQPFLLEASHHAENQKCHMDNSPHSGFNGGTQRQ